MEGDIRMQIDVNMQLSHMLANDIARSGEESAILDTVHALQRPVTRDSLSSDIHAYSAENAQPNRRN